MAGGGFAAYDYVLWHPERLRSLVVAASGSTISQKWRSCARKALCQISKTGRRSFREVSMGYMATNSEGLKRWLEIHDNSQQKGAPGAAAAHNDHVR